MRKISVSMYGVLALFFLSACLAARREHVNPTVPDPARSTNGASEATLSIAITDDYGTPVADVVVEVKNAEGRLVGSCVSDHKGECRIPIYTLGTPLTVHFHAIGFLEVLRRGIILEPGRQMLLPLTLSEGKTAVPSSRKCT